ncbi:hypothetical protein ACLOJK_040334, partial [Asimina triloba]
DTWKVDGCRPLGADVRPRVHCIRLGSATRLAFPGDTIAQVAAKDRTTSGRLRPLHAPTANRLGWHVSGMQSVHRSLQYKGGICCPPYDQATTPKIRRKKDQESVQR